MRRPKWSRQVQTTELCRPVPVPVSRPDFTVLNELAQLYDSMGEALPPKYPLFGRDARYADWLDLVPVPSQA